MRPTRCAATRRRPRCGCPCRSCHRERTKPVDDGHIGPLGQRRPVEALPNGVGILAPRSEHRPRRLMGLPPSIQEPRTKTEPQVVQRPGEDEALEHVSRERRHVSADRGESGGVHSICRSNPGPGRKTDQVVMGGRGGITNKQTTRSQILPFCLAIGRVRRLRVALSGAISLLLDRSTRISETSSRAVDGVSGRHGANQAGIRRRARHQACPRRRGAQPCTVHGWGTQVSGHPRVERSAPTRARAGSAEALVRNSAPLCFAGCDDGGRRDG